MKRLLCAASIFALVVPTAAVAQHHGDKQQSGKQHDGKGGHQGQAHQDRGNGGRHQGRAAASAQPVAQTVQRQRSGHSFSGNRSTVQPVQQQRSVSRQRSNVRTVSNQRSGYRASNIRRVHASTFRYPRGYRYRRWSSGSILPSIFLSSYYFYNDWAAVGAYPPPRGFIWVRYGPDLLLVSRRSGRIRDVIYGVFY